jgi:periplasmic divalent cation tolerance protein
MTDKIVVLSTCPSRDEAERIARLLVEKRLAACVNLIPGVKSIYHWQGAVEESEEVMLVVKSSRELFRHVKEALSHVHSYEVPELIALPVVDGAESYLAWMDREMLNDGGRA